MEDFGAKKGEVPDGEEPAKTQQHSEPSRAEEAERAREILLRTLSRTPRSRFELHQRLVERDISTDIADEILDRYEELGLIDDAEYAAMMVRTRHRERGQARRAIAQELRRRGLSDEHAQAALEQLDDEAEMQRAEELVARRIDSVRHLPRERALQRLVGYLGRRGYSTAQALSVIRPALDQRDDGMI